MDSSSNRPYSLGSLETLYNSDHSQVLQAATAKPGQPTTATGVVLGVDGSVSGIKQCCW